MPPRGVKKGTKRARQYEHIKESLRERGSSEDEAEEIAARTVNKERARHGEATIPRAARVAALPMTRLRADNESRGVATHLALNGFTLYIVH